MSLPLRLPTASGSFRRSQYHQDASIPAVTHCHASASLRRPPWESAHRRELSVSPLAASSSSGGQRSCARVSASAFGAEAAPSGKAVVVAVDDTQASWGGVRWALENLYKEGMILHLIHVVPKESATPPVPVSTAYGVWNTSLEEDVEGHALSFLAEARKAIEPIVQRFNARCEVDIVHGRTRQHVGASICDRAEALDAAVVVVTQQKHGIMDWLLSSSGGSVTDYVSKNCKRPVLVYQQGPYDIGAMGGSAVTTSTIVL